LVCAVRRPQSFLSPEDPSEAGLLGVKERLEPVDGLIAERALR
jgi:hypothetical protein